MPPAALIFSAIIIAVFRSGSPSHEARPVIAKIAPTL